MDWLKDFHLDCSTDLCLGCWKDCWKDCWKNCSTDFH